jgi:hypothetical protein
MKIICQFHQKVSRFFGPRYIGDDFFILIKKSLSTKLPTEERRKMKMNGTAVANRVQNPFKITCTDHRIIELLGLRPSNRLFYKFFVKFRNSKKMYLKLF